MCKSLTNVLYLFLLCIKILNEIVNINVKCYVVNE